MLTKATSIKTYNQYLITHEGEVLENMASWEGKKYFWKIIEVPPVPPSNQIQYKFKCHERGTIMKPQKNKWLMINMGFFSIKIVFEQAGS